MSQSRPTPIRVRSPRNGLVGLAIGVVVVAGACTSAAATPTGRRAPSSASSTAATPAASLNFSAEVDATVAGLLDAHAKYRAGDSQGALDALAETYEERFELIEDPLGDVDHEFMENLLSSSRCGSGTSA